MAPAQWACALCLGVARSPFPGPRDVLRSVGMDSRLCGWSLRVFPWAPSLSPAQTPMNLSKAPLAALLAVSTSLPVAAQGPDFANLADRFLVDHDLGAASPDTVELPQVLESHYLHTAVGLFDLYFPTDSAADIEHYQRMVIALAKAQAEWLDWTAEVGTDARQAQKDAGALAKWASKWDIKRLLREIESGETNLLEATRASSTIVKASERFAASMMRGDSLALERQAGAREPIVLIPERADFVAFLAFGGWLYPDCRDVFWQSEAVNWTHTYIDNIKVLSTRFASGSGGPGGYSAGRSMDYRTSTGMEQQIVQLALNSLFANYYGDRIPPSIAGAMAVNLVIDVYGQCNTRVDGDLRARRTAAREIFVPGGNPNGGILPPNLADSRWRTGHGADYFVNVLQRAHEKRKSSRSAGTQGGAFKLVSDDSRKSKVVAGPFLGANAVVQSLDESYLGEQLEFLRSYRSCFMHWLRMKGGKSASKSEKCFASFLRALAVNEDPEQIEQVFGQVYGRPLSGLMPKGADLESEFMQWLPRAR